MSDPAEKFLIRWWPFTLSALIVGVFVVWHFWSDLFGPGTWGTGGNMVAWIICGAIGGFWLHGKIHAMHLAQMAQQRRHHKERMDQAQDHHEEMKAHITEATSGR